MTSSKQVFIQRGRIAVSLSGWEVAEDGAEERVVGQAFREVIQYVNRDWQTGYYM